MTLSFGSSTLSERRESATIEVTLGSRKHASSTPLPILPTGQKRQSLVKGYVDNNLRYTCNTCEKDFHLDKYTL